LNEVTSANLGRGICACLVEVMYSDMLSEYIAPDARLTAHFPPIQYVNIIDRNFAGTETRFKLLWRLRRIMDEILKEPRK
jgi:hypothetical protein